MTCNPSVDDIKLRLYRIAIIILRQVFNGNQRNEPTHEQTKPTENLTGKQKQMKTSTIIASQNQPTVCDLSWKWFSFMTSFEMTATSTAKCVKSWNNFRIYSKYIWELLMWIHCLWIQVGWKSEENHKENRKKIRGKSGENSTPTHIRHITGATSGREFATWLSIKMPFSVTFIFH